jgi:hypothetical protein
MNQVEINKSIRLSPHFLLSELTVTDVKTKDGNVPSHVAIENLKRLCEWLEHLRAQYNLLYGDGSHPIIINSGFRSEAVNRKVGGAPNSNHLSGCAVDIKVSDVIQVMRYGVILADYANLTGQKFDELLVERSKKGSYWLHFAVRPKENRRKLMFIQT